MNRILAWFYRFRPIRLAWWRLKRHRYPSFNDREEIQEQLDLGLRTVLLSKPVYYIDHTIYLTSHTTLQGTHHLSGETAK